MIHDARIEVTCDGAFADGGICTDSIEIEPPYVFDSFSGESGHYDDSERTLNRLIEAEGWTVIGERHLCEECAEAEDE